MEENPFLTRKYLAHDAEKFGWRIGNHTYGAPNVMEHEYGGLEIGRFCSIAMHVTLILGGHVTSSLSSYPFKTFFGFWPGAEAGSNDHEDRGGIVIGNDVWIAKGVTILAGSRVADGAVLGADTVISGVVEPYAIMVGNPSRMVRRRFDEETVRHLLDIAWWNWPDDKILQEIRSITSGNVQEFIQKFRESESALNNWRA